MSENENTNLSDYQNFVIGCCSEPTISASVLAERILELDKNTHGVKIAEVITAHSGLPAESGEFTEIVKKILYQGKPLNEDSIFHMKRELGDIAFYWVLAAHSIGLDPAEVIQENINKLSARYPNGFEVARSENRKQGDL